MILTTDSSNLYIPTWNNGQNTFGVVVRNSGKYFVSLKYTFGCIGPKSDSVVVNVKPSPNTPIIIRSGINHNSLYSSGFAPLYIWYQNGIRL